MSDGSVWDRVDGYVEGRLGLRDAALESALRASEAGGLPAIAVSPALGALLRVLAVSVGARRILEIGTLGGYSAIHLARALPVGGRLVTLELEERHAAVARASLEGAGLGDRAEVIVGPALETLGTLAGGPPFDFVFIDADKANIPAYVRASLGLVRPGALIVVDNVVRGGALADASDTDPSTVGVRALHDMLGAEGAPLATTVQTVGVKGHDGLTLLVAP